MGNQIKTPESGPRNEFVPDREFVERYEAVTDQHARDLDGTPGRGIVVHRQSKPAFRGGRPRGRTTNNQWRSHFQEAPVLDLPPKTPEADAVMEEVMSQLGRRVLTGATHAHEPRVAPSRTLVGSNGRAVLGSLAWSEERVTKYLEDNPGARIE